MIPTKTRGWRTYRFGERVVEIRKLELGPGMTLGQALAYGSKKGYRYLNGSERQKLLQDRSSNPGYLAVPTDYWSATICEVLQSGAIRETIRSIAWLVGQNVPYSVLMAED